MNRVETIKREESPTLCDVLHDICICMESIGGYATLLVDGEVEFRAGDYLTVESRRAHWQVRLPIYGTVAAALSALRADKIELVIEATDKPKPFKATTGGLKQAVDSIFQANFLHFYIKGEAVLVEGTDWSWGPSWRFAWAIRNALAHNGCIHFSNARKPAVEWDGLKFDHSNNGHPVLERDIGPADLVLLMIDMAKELKQAT